MSSSAEDPAFELFSRARQLPKSKRNQYLEEACGDDVELRREIESLLDHSKAHDDLSEQALAEKRRALTTTSRMPRTIGPYRIEGLLGEGGMGTIYVATQQTTNRRVALKILKAWHLSKTAQSRFQDEVEILGRLEHRGIAQIYDAGTADLDGNEIPYIAMELVKGRTLGEWGQGKTTEQCARVLVEIAEAVHHAHQRGVIHRDLKPANVMVDRRGHAKILDFGIAKAMGADNSVQRAHTQTGQIVGTLTYMSPEQIEGRSGALSFTSDVYALGVVAYELFAGHPPHRIDGLPLGEIIRLVCRRRAPSLRSVCPDLPRDLELVCSKALAIEPADRYSSARDLADDLERWLEDRPIVARPTSTFHNIQLFARRNRGLVTATTLVFILLTAAVIALSILAKRESEQRMLAQEETRRAEHLSYRLAVSFGSVAIRENRVAEAKRLLEDVPERFRNWEWRHVHGQLDQSIHRYQPRDPRNPFPAGPPHLFDDGNKIAVLRNDQKDGALTAVVTVWDTRTGELLVEREVIDSDQLISTNKERPKLTFNRAGRLSVHVPDRGIVFEEDLLTGERGPRFEIPVLPVRTEGEDLDLVTIGNSQLFRRPGDRTWHFLVESGRIESFCRTGSQGGRAALVGYGRSRRTIELYDTTSGELIERIDDCHETPYGIAISPDGESLAYSCRENLIVLRSIAPPKSSPPIVLQGHGDRVNDVCFSPDGKLVASCSQDSTIRVWSRTDGSEIGSFMGHQAQVVSLRFQDSGTLYSIDDMGLARSWDLDSIEDQILRGHELFVYPVALSPNGHRIASGDWRGALRFWDGETGAALGSLQLLKSDEPYDVVFSLAFSDDGTRLAATCGHGIFEDHHLKIIDSTFGKPLADLGPIGKKSAVAFTKNPPRLIATSSERTLVFDPETHEVLATLPGGGKFCAVSPQGDAFALRNGEGDLIQVRSAKNFEILKSLKISGSDPVALAFSPRGDVVAVASELSIEIFDWRRGLRLAELQGHEDEVFSLAFSPDGTRLASGSDDRSIRIWDSMTFEELLRLSGHQDHVMSLAWSPNGRRIISGSGDYTLRFWDDTSATERHDLRARRARRIETLRPRVIKWLDGSGSQATLQAGLGTLTPSDRELAEQLVLSRKLAASK